MNTDEGGREEGVEERGRKKVIIKLDVYKL